MALAVFLCEGAVAAVADWLPPSNPNPETILSEAEADAAAGRYSDALAKHLWFHENALTYAPAMYGVRLSFALSSWGYLACIYPPALEQLENVRDIAADDVRERRDSRHAFNDFASINRELEEEQKTKDLFLWLDENDPRLASEVFDIAEPALVEQRQYLVCGKYLDPERSFQRMVHRYRETTRISKKPGLKDVKDLADHSFANQSATLVALLVLNERKAEAEEIALRARRPSRSRNLNRQLDAALRGICPPRWP